MKYPWVVAENPHRHGNDGRRPGLDRAHVDSRAGDSPRKRVLERTDEAIGVFASRELKEELRVVRRRGIRTHGKPEARTTRADERRDGRERRRLAGVALV